MGGQRAILVVDDDPSIRLLCRVNLEQDGFRVLEAYDLAGAVEHAAGANLVLLDLHLGQVSGRDVVDPVRAAAPGVPLVLLTGSAEVEADLRALVDDVITKPFTIDGLRETAGRLASRV
jgi:two-component system, NtrC family, C4-dicarboxylate transport response regulator DctD